jgi:hypothetical protein
VSVANHQLASEQMHKRLNDNVCMLYQNYAFFVTGAVVAAAGVAMYLILTTDGAVYRIERGILWFASFGFACANIATWTRIAIFSNWRANAWDFVLPVLTGVAEVLMFAVLSPLPNEPETRWFDWYLVFGLFAIFAGLLSWNRRLQAHKGEYASDETTTQLCDAYRQWLRNEIFVMALFGVVALAFYAAARLWPSFIPMWEGWGWQRTADGFLVVVAGLMVYFSAGQFKTIAGR